VVPGLAQVVAGGWVFTVEVEREEQVRIWRPALRGRTSESRRVQGEQRGVDLAVEHRSPPRPFAQYSGSPSPTTSGQGPHISDSNYFGEMIFILNKLQIILLFRFARWFLTMKS